MKRIVHVVGRNGKEYNVPMTAEQAAFYLRLAEFKAFKDPTINFITTNLPWRAGIHQDTRFLLSLFVRERMDKRRVSQCSPSVLLFRV